MESASIAFCYEALRHCYNILGKERFRAETEYIMKLYDTCGSTHVGPEKVKPNVEEVAFVEDHVGNVLKNLLIETNNKSQPKNEVIVEKPVVEEPEFIELPISSSIKPEEAKSKKKSKLDVPEALQKSVMPEVSLKPEASQNSVKPDVSLKPEPTQSKWKRTQLPDEIRCQRILAYNGGQCTFKKEDGSEFCPRHINK
jgi:hypothetical protein